MKKIITYYLKPYYGFMALGFTVKFLGTVMDLLLPWILAYMIDEVIPQKSQKLILLWGGGMLICAVFAVSFNIMANRMASRVGRDATEKIRMDLFERVMYLSGSQMDNYTKPSIIARLTSDTYHVHQMISMVQRIGVRGPLLVMGGICITLTLDVPMAFVLILILPILGFVVFYISHKTIPMYESLQEAVDRFVRLVREDIGGIRVIKALSKTQWEKNKFRTMNDEVIRREKKANLTMAATSPIMNVVLNAGLLGVIYVGAVRVNAGLTEVGKILAFMTYFTIILNSMMMISRVFVMLSKGSASAGRINAILEAEEELVIQDCPFPDTEEDARAYIAFDHVSFAYGGEGTREESSSLEDISFCLKKGETLGIIGATGAGKTTVVNLLMRFYDVSRGAIYIEGKNIKSMSLKDLRKRFGAAFQNDMIFEDTISSNISFGRELTGEEIQNAALYARAKEFIETRESKYEERLSIKGANLSGGQKQRIVIARALAAKPDILILDDSSSALDYKTDGALRKGIREHFKDTTTIIIAQRISSVMQADHIMVLEEGRIDGFGTHEELMESCEIYREISRSQLAQQLRIYQAGFASHKAGSKQRNL